MYVRNSSKRRTDLESRGLGALEKQKLHMWRNTSLTAAGLPLLKMRPYFKVDVIIQLVSAHGKLGWIQSTASKPLTYSCPGFNNYCGFIFSIARFENGHVICICCELELCFGGFDRHMNFDFHMFSHLYIWRWHLLTSGSIWETTASPIVNPLYNNLGATLFKIPLLGWTAATSYFLMPRLRKVLRSKTWAKKTKVPSIPHPLIHKIQKRPFRRRGTAGGSILGKNKN
jgi:hypothetical protein